MSVAETVDWGVRAILALAGVLGTAGITKYLLLPSARKRDRADTDSVVVGGAEKAVLSLEKALQHAEKQIERLQEQDAVKDRRIEALEKALRTAGIPIPDLT